MTVRVRRTFDVGADIDDVWDLLSDDTKRAEAISIVESFETVDGETRWQISLPIPVIDRTITVKTRDLEREPPSYVKFVGKSRVFNVTGEHELSDNGDGCRVQNTFVVDGKVPGVERYFKKNIDEEIENIMYSVSDTVSLV